MALMQINDLLRCRAARHKAPAHLSITLQLLFHLFKLGGKTKKGGERKTEENTHFALSCGLIGGSGGEVLASRPRTCASIRAG